MIATRDEQPLEGRRGRRRAGGRRELGVHRRRPERGHAWGVLEPPPQPRRRRRAPAARAQRRLGRDVADDPADQAEQHGPLRLDRDEPLPRPRHRLPAARRQRRGRATTTTRRPTTAQRGTRRRSSPTRSRPPTPSATKTASASAAAPRARGCEVTLSVTWIVKPVSQGYADARVERPCHVGIARPSFSRTLLAA